MADFTISQIGGVEPSASGPSPQPGIKGPIKAADPSTSSPWVAGLNLAAGVGSSIFETMAAARKNEQQTEINKAVNRFSAQQMQFADWVDRGELSSQEARMRMRNNLIKASADNPNLAEAFQSAHEAVVTTAGMGKVTAEGTEQEQQFFKVMTEARDNGFILPGMSQEQEIQRTYDWMELQNARLKRELAMEELQHQQAQVSLEGSRVSLATGRLNLAKARQEKAITDATIEGSRAFFPAFASQVQGIVAGVQAGELDPVAADLQFRQMLDNVVGEFSQGGAVMSPSVIANLTTQYERTIATAQGVISGQFGADVMQSMADNAIQSTELLILANDDTRALAATSNILGPAASTLLQVHGAEPTRQALSIYKGNDKTEGTRPNPFAAEDGALNAWATIMNTGLTQVNRDQPSPIQGGAENELARQINGVLESTGKYADGEDFTVVKPVLREIASDEYGAYVTGKGRGMIRKENESAVQDYTQRLFIDEVQPLISEEWRNASTRLSALRVGPGPEGATEEAPTSSLIRPMFTGDGVRFIKTNQAGENPRIDAEVRRLNQRVSPAVNLFIRLGAHLEEHTNYQKIYEANFAQMFGNPGTGATEQE